MAGILHALAAPVSLASRSLLLGQRPKIAAKMVNVGIKRSLHPDCLSAKTPPFDIYYPTSPATSTSATPAHSMPWLPTYQNGAQWSQFALGDKLGETLSELLIGTIAYALFSRLAIAAHADGDLCGKEGKYRVVIFSHGLATWGSFYSTLCASVANRMGVVVVAIDHNDGSATRARGKGGEVLYERVEKETEMAVRQRQLRTRVEEVKECWAFLKGVNEGTAEGLDMFRGKLDVDGYCAMGHSFGGGTAAAVSDDPECLGAGEKNASEKRASRLAQERARRAAANEDRLEPRRKTRMKKRCAERCTGSASSTCALPLVQPLNRRLLPHQALPDLPRLHLTRSFDRAVCLDPWLIPVKDAGFLGGQGTPKLFVTADSGFLSNGKYWRGNCALIKDFKGDADEAVRMRGQDHNDVTDIHLVMPSRGGIGADPFFESNMRLVTRFLRDKVGWEEVAQGGGDDDEDFVQRQEPY